MSATPTVPAIIPLSLFEAIRGLDTPLGDGLEDLAPEIVTRRLGLSRTVAVQIARYGTAAAAAGRVPRDEAVSVLRLVGRRADAPLAFADAGRRVARHAAGGRRPGGRVLGGWTTPLGRRLRARTAAQVVRRIFEAELQFRPDGVEVVMDLPLSVQAMPDGEACDFYAAAFAELLRALTGFEGTMAHERCRARGDDACVWRAAAGEEYE